MTESGAWLVATFSAIFFVVDPVAVVPLFLAMTPGEDAAKRARTATRACIVATVVLVAFAGGGQVLFHALGITIPAFRVAGGLLLLLTALDELQVRPPATRTTAGEIAEGTAKEDIAVVPLAMPLLAGPGAIATVVVLAAQAKERWQIGAVVLAIVVTTGVAWALMQVAERVDRLLGATVRAVIVRVSGLLLAAVGVQFVVSGLAELFPGLVE